MKNATYDRLFARYGLRLNLNELAELKRIDRRTALNQIYAGRFNIPVYKEGSEWWADTRSVSDYLDSRQQEAEQAASPLRMLGKTRRAA